MCQLMSGLHITHDKVPAGFLDCLNLPSIQVLHDVFCNSLQMPAPSRFQADNNRHTDVCRHSQNHSYVHKNPDAVTLLHNCTAVLSSSDAMHWIGLIVLLIFVGKCLLSLPLTHPLAVTSSRRNRQRIPENILWIILLFCPAQPGIVPLEITGYIVVQADIAIVSGTRFILCNNCLGLFKVACGYEEKCHQMHSKRQPE